MQEEQLYDVEIEYRPQVGHRLRYAVTVRPKHARSQVKNGYARSRRKAARLARDFADEFELDKAPKREADRYEIVL